MVNILLKMFNVWRDRDMEELPSSSSIHLAWSPKVSYNVYISENIMLHVIQILQRSMFEFQCKDTIFFQTSKLVNVWRTGIERAECCILSPFTLWSKATQVFGGQLQRCIQNAIIFYVIFKEKEWITPALDFSLSPPGGSCQILFATRYLSDLALYQLIKQSAIHIP